MCIVGFIVKIPFSIKWKGEPEKNVEIPEGEFSVTEVISKKGKVEGYYVNVDKICKTAQPIISLMDVVGLLGDKAIELVKKGGNVEEDPSVNFISNWR